MYSPSSRGDPGIDPTSSDASRNAPSIGVSPRSSAPPAHDHVPPSWANADRFCNMSRGGRLVGVTLVDHEHDPCRSVHTPPDVTVTAPHESVARSSLLHHGPSVTRRRPRSQLAARDLGPSQLNAVWGGCVLTHAGVIERRHDRAVRPDHHRDRFGELDPGVPRRLQDRARRARCLRRDVHQPGVHSLEDVRAAGRCRTRCGDVGEARHPHPVQRCRVADDPRSHLRAHRPDLGRRT